MNRHNQKNYILGVMHSKRDNSGLCLSTVGTYLTLRSHRATSLPVPNRKIWVGLIRVRVNQSALLRNLKFVPYFDALLAN